MGIKTKSNTCPHTPKVNSIDSRESKYRIVLSVLFARERLISEVKQ